MRTKLRVLAFLIPLIALGCSQQSESLSRADFDSIATDFTESLSDVIERVGDSGLTLSGEQALEYVTTVPVPISLPIALEERGGQKVIFPVTQGELPKVTVWGSKDINVYVVSVNGTIIGKGQTRR